MWLLFLIVVKCNSFLLESGIFHGYLLVTRWLLVGYSFMQLFMRYPIKEDTNLDKNDGLLLKRCYLLLHLLGIWQIMIVLLFSTEPCIGNANI